MAASNGAAHVHATERWRHGHVFLGAQHERNERRTRIVIALCAAMMVGEIAAGWLFGSMALVADGWHMSTHAGALAIAGLAYWYARRHAGDPRFAFGTGKLGDLAGFTSAVVLALVALAIAYESAQRLFVPVAISFREAIPIAVLGLVVNLVSASLLSGGDEVGHHHDDHHHGDASAHRHHHHHHDNNFRSAYTHVLADAATSVLAITGLSLGLLLGWVWLDPAIGVVGAIVIANWSYTLIRDAGAVLLDVNTDSTMADAIRRTLETGGDRLTDLHLWRIGPGHCGAIVALVSATPQAPAHYKTMLSGIDGLSHVTVEVQPCDDLCLGANGA
jgi:cation diffusion facilitator family transporter